MHALHRQLQEKRELHYETRHLVIAGGLLIVYGLAMFYAGMIVGEENRAKGLSYGPVALRSASDGLVDKVKRVLLGSAEAVASQKKVEPAPATAELPREPDLPQLATMGISIPARAPKPKAAAVKVITSDGPIPLEAPVFKPLPQETPAPVAKRTTPKKVKQAATRATPAAPAPKAAPEKRKRAVTPVAKAEAPRKAAKAARASVAPSPAPAPKIAKRKKTSSKKARSRTPKRKAKKALKKESGFTLQVHALANVGAARDVARALGVFRGQKARVQPVKRNGGQLYRVLVGSFDTIAEAKEFQKAFETRRGLSKTIAVPL